MGKKQSKSKTYKYSEAFVEKALATWTKLRSEGSTSTEAAKSIGVSEPTLYVWKAKADSKAAGIQKLAPRQPERPRAMVARKAYDPETAGLKREIDTLREEIEILTKTVMVFARRRG